jgi:DNA end-binding protein Ku
VTRDYEPPTFTPEATDGARRSLPGADERFAEGGRRPQHEPDMDLPAESLADVRDVVRGLQLPTGDVVTVTDEELELVAPERSRTIEVEEFVDLAAIDPIFFEKSYYVAPTSNTGADKSYLLLLRAMQAAGMVGIGRFVLRTKPHLVAIRPLDRVLGLETLYFGDEVRKPEELTRLPEAPLSERELETAQQLIGAMSAEWIPDRHADVYREELLDFLRSKPATARAVEVEAAASADAVSDLMAALKASVEAAKAGTRKVRRTRPKTA